MPTDRIEEQMAVKMYFINGAINGAYVGWHSNGSKEIEASFKHGLKDKLYTRWYANGQKKIEGKYTANPTRNTEYKTGDWSYWNEDGESLNKENYKEGVLIRGLA